MLLSFPLDPDPSTLELISDLIYANSTTLDGRRFASEYVTRRKADAKSGAATGSAAGSKATLSIEGGMILTERDAGRGGLHRGNGLSCDAVPSSFALARQEKKSVGMRLKSEI